ncbi:hypothetical protein BUL40_09905 [Croceivirga radicis]|uniref:Arsenate reductase n=1 Tax=Croceivirga radicis TaxID=1929488 RepID=A0A1V6LQI5_9FLAO|nr:hypothetical protein [Croceivirga radicis]OQD42432.1 hypothetical protein BUL40_09905 [Croceivirga radicis]
MKKDMGVLATDKNQLIYIYSAQSDIGKKLLAYAKSTDMAMRAINIDEEKIANTVWAEISEMLGLEFSKIFSTNVLSNDMKDFKSSDENDWLKIVQNNSEVLQKPIVIHDTTAKVVANRYDIGKFFEADGGNLDKSPDAIKNANHTDTTDKEAF